MSQFTDAVLARLNDERQFTPTQLYVIQSAVSEVADRFTIAPKGNAIMTNDVRSPEAYKAFLAVKITEGLSRQTLTVYKCVLDSFFMAVHKPIAEITETDIRLYIYGKQADGKCSVRGANNIRNYLSSFFGWAYKNKYIQDNPMLNIKKIKGVEKAFVPLTPDQFELIMSTVKEPRNRAMIAVMAGSGIRIGEIVSMKRQTLDLSNNKFLVLGKGSRERICFLTPRAKRELEQYLRTRDDDCEYVFITKRKPFRHISNNTINKLFEELSQQLGFRIHPHMFRHFFADSAHDAGVDVLDISRMLGHRSVNTTSIYLTNNTADLAKKHAQLR